MICPHCGKETDTPPVKIKSGDHVKHKKRKKLGIGKVMSISGSGKKAFVFWPSPSGGYGYPFSAYYDLDRLEVAE